MVRDGFMLLLDKIEKWTWNLCFLLTEVYEQVLMRSSLKKTSNYGLIVDFWFNGPINAVIDFSVYV